MVIFDQLEEESVSILQLYFDENGIKNNIFLHKIILYKITYKMLFYSLHPSNKITT